MDWLQTLLDNSSTPVLTASLLGLLTAVSPCPLATNIAAVGYIGKDVENRKTVFFKGMLYVLGRTFTYTLLGVVIIRLLRSGSSAFGIQAFLARYGEMLVGPFLLLAGLFMLWGDRIPLPSFGLRTDGERIAHRGGWGALLLGLLFALAFCPTSGVFYFGMLIPLAASSPMGYFLPVFFAIATALPVLLVSWVLAFSVQRIGGIYGRIRQFGIWFGRITAVLFLLVGLYYCRVFFL